MVDRKISISQQSYKTLSKIIIAYTLYKNSASINEISQKYGIQRSAVSYANGFLIDMGIIRGVKGKEKKTITEKGERLGRALKYNQDDVKNAWVDLIQDNPFYIALFQKLSRKQVFSRDQIIGAIFQLSDTPEYDDTKIGARAIIQILQIAEYIESASNKDEFKIGSNSFVDEKRDGETPDSFYVDPNRVGELKSISSGKFDLTKLIEFCEELNSCYDNGNFLSVIMLVRGILDHTPPVFGFDTFVEVANNYGGKSLKKSLLNLQNSSRNIADAHLHETIRSREALPNKTQVDFRNDLDVLLGEIVRLLK